MTTGGYKYMPKTQDYYLGYEDGYKVAMQEVIDFYERMGMGRNYFTGTICVRQKEVLRG